jgi:NAD(P)-dependent dehydrogenase (short-subunit alcohol dehydrogenase family)
MMAREGVHVAFTYHLREQVDADAAKERIAANGERVLALPVDFAVGGEAACEGIVAAVVEEFGHVDCLVNNAAVQYDPALPYFSPIIDPIALPYFSPIALPYFRRFLIRLFPTRRPAL